MLWNLDELKGLRLHATDGDLGHVHDALVEDDSWQLRYLVVDTGWIFGRRVLIGPQALGLPDAGTRVLPVRLTRQQIQDSPGIDTDQPVGRQQEDALYAYYGWAPYWTAGGAAGMAGGAPTLGLGTLGLTGGGDITGGTGPLPTAEGIPGAAGIPRPTGDPHLRSAREMQGYAVRAGRREVARLSSFLLDEEGWQVRWLVVDTGSAMTSRLVLLDPARVGEIDWAAATVDVEVPPDRLDGAPEYDPTAPADAALEEATRRWFA